MNKFAKVSIGIAVVAVVFMAGWGASDILMVERLLITGVNDEIRVSIGTDSMGGGFIIVKDFQGREVFSVRGNKVTTASGPEATPAPSSRLLPQLSEWFNCCASKP